MKKCALCNQTYTDDSLNFCLDDGGTLERMNEDAAPTVFMNQARTTDQTNWTNNSAFTPPNQAPVSPWQNNQPFAAPNTSYTASHAYQSPNQTLPVVSLILGILGVVICCWGSPLGIGALVTGYIGYGNANKDPDHYGGRGLAIVGMILGAVSIAELIFFILAAGK